MAAIIIGSLLYKHTVIIILRLIVIESMLKRASEERDDGDDYRGVRDRAVVAIRKCKREDIFNKRRNQCQFR
jgi:hypothetical protein